MRVTQSELARQAGVTPQRIGQLVQAGSLTLGDDKLLDLASSLKAMGRDQDPVKVNIELEKKGINAPDPDGFRAARAAKVKAEAMRVALKVDRERGRLIEREAALAACADVVVAVRRGLLEVPDRVAGEVAICSSAPQCREIIGKAIEAALTELASLPEALNG